MNSVTIQWRTAGSNALGLQLSTRASGQTLIPTMDDVIITYKHITREFENLL